MKDCRDEICNLVDTKLSEVIGGLMVGINRARFIADAEYARIAYRYKNDDILRGLNVPRLKLKHVNIDVPIILKEAAYDHVSDEETINNMSKVLVSEILGGLHHLSTGMMKQGNHRPNKKGHRNDITETFELAEEEKEQLEKTMTRAVIQCMRRLRDIDHLGYEELDSFLTTVCEATRDEIEQGAIHGVWEVLKESDQPGNHPTTKYDPKIARKWVLSDDCLKQIIRRTEKVACEYVLETSVLQRDFYVSAETSAIQSVGSTDHTMRLKLDFVEEGGQWVCEEGDHDNDTRWKLVGN